MAHMYEAAHTDDVLDDEEELQGITLNKRRRAPLEMTRRDSGAHRLISLFRQNVGMKCLALSFMLVILVAMNGGLRLKVNLNESTVKQPSTSVENPPSPPVPVVVPKPIPAPAPIEPKPVVPDLPVPSPPIDEKPNNPPAPAPAPSGGNNNSSPSENETTPDYGNWGHWKFYDGGAEDRPDNDYCGEADPVHRDIKGDDLPQNSWQVDAVYVNHFLDEALKLVQRTKEAIYTEYGAGEPLDEIKTGMRKEMFHIAMIDCDSELSENERWKGVTGQGGWICRKSFDGLVRRLLHAMMTNDSFNIVLGGHSAAAGHGNHFSQSYVITIGTVLGPVFERLGMKLITRNAAHGGLGTLQSALGAKDIYGHDIDYLIWDSRMTENTAQHVDVFVRQALLTKRAPLIHNAYFVKKSNFQMDMYNAYGADLAGSEGNNYSGFPVTTSDQQAATLPYAAQYLTCSPDFKNACNSPDNKYSSKCWVDRDDFTPSTRQLPVVGGRASWHPGWREHQVIGRGHAMLILSALENALSQWSEITIHEGHPLPDEYWHVTEYYKSIHDKVKTAETPYCAGIMNEVNPRICNTSLNARTEFTPRADPDNTSIRSILKAAPGENQLDLGIDGKGIPLLYEGPDVDNPALHLPDDAVNAATIAGYRSMRTLSAETQKSDIERNLDQITPGNLWYANSYNGYCDGTIQSYTCHRDNSNDCLLSGHNDNRSGIIGDEYSGWLVMNLKDVKEGIIVIKLHAWKNSIVCGLGCVNPRTNGMDQENRRFLRINKDENENEIYELGNDFTFGTERELKVDPVEATPDTFLFDFAINGNITTWDKNKFYEQRKMSQRVVELFSLMDDPTWKGGDVELAIRTRGAGRIQALDITHVYWA